MPLVAGRTYSFRAPAGLAERISEAAGVLVQLAGSTSHPAVADQIAAELVLALVRDTARFKAAGANRSAFVRDTVELMVGAVEKVAADLGHAEAYAQAASARGRGEVEFRQASRGLTARRWHDG